MLTGEVIGFTPGDGDNSTILGRAQPKSTHDAAGFAKYPSASAQNVTGSLTTWTIGEQTDSHNLGLSSIWYSNST
jgi:hypothetical protein